MPFLRASRGDEITAERRKASTGHDHTSHQLQRLQQLAGNAAVTRLLERPARQGGEESATVADATEFTVEALIPSHAREPGVWPAAPPGRQTVPQLSDRDPEEDEGGGGDVDPRVVEENFMASIVPVPEPESGGTVALPDMSLPVSSDGADRDAVVGAITYASTVTQAGVVQPFGSTTWHNFAITGATVTPTPTNPRMFAVRFTLNNPITFNVTSPKVSIASASDPAITAANHPDVATDLTPRMTVQGGKPLRRNFWARDLTVIHEQFHCAERQRFAAAGTVQAQAWLNAQTAGSVADVQALIARVPARVVAASTAAVGTVDAKETRAYAAGAPAYQARADAIRAKGALAPGAGGYP